MAERPLPVSIAVQTVLPADIVSIQEEYRLFKVALAAIKATDSNRDVMFKHGADLQKAWRARIQTHLDNGVDAETVKKLIELFETQTKQKFDLTAGASVKKDVVDLKLPTAAPVVQEKPKTESGWSFSGLSTIANGFGAGIADKWKSATGSAQKFVERAKDDLNTRIYGVDLSIPPATVRVPTEEPALAERREDPPSPIAEQFKSFGDAFRRAHAEKEMEKQMRALPTAREKRPVTPKPVTKVVLKPAPQRPVYRVVETPKEPELTEEAALENLASTMSPSPKVIPAEPTPAAPRDWSNLLIDPSKRWANLKNADRIAYV